MDNNLYFYYSIFLVSCAGQKLLVALNLHKIKNPASTITLVTSIMIVALAVEKDRGENKLEGYAKNLLIWWCLCDYFYKYEDVNNLLHHEKVKLRGVFKDCCRIKFKKLDSEKIKKSFLENLWIEEEEYIIDPSNVIPSFIEKFDDENIEYDDDKYLNVSKDFVKDIPKIISLISEGDHAKCVAYVNSRFPE